MTGRRGRSKGDEGGDEGQVTATEKLIMESTGATGLRFIEQVQSLWSGYGAIDRFQLIGCDNGGDGKELPECVAKARTVIVKHVQLQGSGPASTSCSQSRGRHPRGWDTSLSHQRKLRSYEVETAWYRHHASDCDDCCRVPACIESHTYEDGLLIILEDLDASGFAGRASSLTLAQARLCLRWLAYFHARFMGREPLHLWECGCYWHLDTRPDELAAMEAGKLKDAAWLLDKMLRECKYQTFVHGDAKVANFCFADDGSSVAAVDFQYVGQGCGMKDVAYFVGSAFDEDECKQHEEELLSAYFEYLSEALAHYGRLEEYDPNEIEQAWRPLYHVAWTDFYRFLRGWSPGHWKVHAYTKSIAKKVLATIATSPATYNHHHS